MDLGEGAGGTHPSSLYLLLKFIYLTSQFLSGVLPPKKTPGSPLGGKENREPEERRKSRRKSSVSSCIRVVTRRTVFLLGSVRSRNVCILSVW